MCAIIGGNFNNLTEADITLIFNMFKEAKIRGKHATGISWIGSDEKVKTISKPEPADVFVKYLEMSRYLDIRGFLGKKFSFIGHCRYSTSDLEYNQPIADDNLSIVHNGVVTQEEPSLWSKLFGYTEFMTKNDSELIFKCHKEGKYPQKEFPQASFAVGGINNKGLFFYRNGKRPLHYSYLNDNLIFSSTRDIIVRAVGNKAIETQKCNPNIMYTRTHDGKGEHIVVNYALADLQP